MPTSRQTPSVRRRFGSRCDRSALLLAVLVPTSFGCFAVLGDPRVERGSGVTAEQVRDVGSFSRIALYGSADLRARVGETASLVVEADDNLLDNVETAVEGDTLVVRTHGRFRTTRPIVVTVTAPRLTDLDLFGSGDAEVDGIDAEAFSVTVRGSGDVLAEGRAGRLAATVYGSGNLDLARLVAASAEAEVNGSGDIALHVEERLAARVRGSGDIAYAGSPDAVDRSILGSGSIRPR